MFFATRLLLFVCLLLSPWVAQAQFFSSSSSSAEFLPVNEAFTASAWHDGDRLYIGMQNADGYYLYRHRFSLELTGAPDALGELSLPPGEAKTDEFLGDVNVFYDQVVFSAPLTETRQGPLDIALTFQGCADAGLCYPPERLELAAAQSEPPAAFADALKGGQAANESTPQGAGAALTGQSPTSQEAGSLPAASVGEAPLSEDGRFRALMQDASLPLMLGLFFVAGLGLTFTPCVLPMIPILSSIIVGQNPSRPRAFALSASYVAGMAATYYNHRSIQGTAHGAPGYPVPGGTGKLILQGSKCRSTGHVELRLPPPPCPARDLPAQPTGCLNPKSGASGPLLNTVRHGTLWGCAFDFFPTSLPPSAWPWVPQPPPHRRRA